MRRFIIVVFCIFFVCGVMFYLISIPRNVSAVTAVGGLLDLMSEDFSGTLFNLNGEWEYYEGELYTPDDFRNGGLNGNDLGVDKALIYAPMAWHHGNSPFYGYATFRLTIKTNEPELLMLIPELMDASILWVNGRMVFEAGEIGKTKSETVARVRNAFTSFHPENGQVEIIIQAANYDIIERWATFGIQIGRPGVLLNDAMGRRILVGLSIGMLLTIFIYHGIVFFLRYKDWVNLFIAVISLLGVAYIILETNGFAALFLPDGIGLGLNRFYFLLKVLQLFIMIGFTFVVLKMPLKNKSIYAFYCIFFIILILIVFLPYSLWNGLLAYTGLIPASFTLIYALRSGKLKNNPHNLLYVLSIAFFNIWNHICWYILNDTFFMQSVFSYMFLMLSQCMILSISFTETKHREEVLTERNVFLNNLNRMKTEFLQDMSHEMKAPLTLIATGIDYTEREIKKEDGNLPKAITVLDKIQNETQRLGRMINGMLKLASMKEAGENRRRVDLAALLIISAETFRLALEQRNNNLQVEIASGMPDVFVEKDRFIQVIANLISNATDHTQNGRITLTTEYNRSFITVKVIDTGSGISPDILPDIFERGISGRSGTGYGLSLCKTIVEAHGGIIEIDSKPAEGTTVMFTVPVYGGQEVGHKHEKQE